MIMFKAFSRNLRSGNLSDLWGYSNREYKVGSEYSCNDITPEETWKETYKGFCMVKTYEDLKRYLDKTDNIYSINCQLEVPDDAVILACKESWDIEDIPEYWCTKMKIVKIIDKLDLAGFEFID